MEKTPHGWGNIDWEALNIEFLGGTLSNLKPDQQATLTFQYGLDDELPVSISAILHRIVTDDGTWHMEATPKAAYIAPPDSTDTGILFPGSPVFNKEGILTEDDLVSALLGNDIRIECVQRVTRYALSKVIGAVVGVGPKQQI